MRKTRGTSSLAYIGPTKCGDGDVPQPRSSEHTPYTIYTFSSSNMSDGEGHGGMPPSDDDLSLPKATVAKMITGVFSMDSHSDARFRFIFSQNCSLGMYRVLRRRVI